MKRTCFVLLGILLFSACRKCPEARCLSPLDSRWLFLEGFTGLKTGDTVYVAKYARDNIYKAKDSFLLKINIGLGNTQPDSIVLELPQKIDINYNWRITIPRDTVYWFTDFVTLPLTCDACGSGYTWFTWVEYKINGQKTMGYWRIKK